MLNSPSSPHHHQEAVRTVRAGGEVHGGDEELRGGAVEGADEDRAKIVVAKALGEGVGGVAAEDGEGEAVRQGVYNKYTISALPLSLQRFRNEDLLSSLVNHANDTNGSFSRDLNRYT
ncbi:hypothetical protein GmHk_17G049012 [Glycine max]|nr:hypothetical protein GmHk_17G049012 [Glycine max]